MGPDRTLGLDVLVQGDLLVRVHRAQERAAGVERGLDLGLGELRAALGAGALDHGVDAGALLEVHQVAVPTTCFTGSPAASSPPACMSAAHEIPCGVEGTRSVKWHGPCIVRVRRASSSSGDSAV